jgi:NAD-dependent dihydropyrimidine dehydrogenase PreA subunit
MKRTIINIDEDLCNGCGDCIPNCHEGALQVIDGKARLISDLMCDGLGACVGHCPVGAITMEEREAEPYNETLVMEQIVKKGRNTVLAHISHLRDHNQKEFLHEAIEYIRSNNIDLSPGGALDKGNGQPTIQQVRAEHKHSHGGGGCPGAAMADFRENKPEVHVHNHMHESAEIGGGPSELRQWPVQLHLLNPNAPYFKNADVVLAADCAAFAHGNFHQKFMKGKTLAIACPKLDSNQESYLDKLTAMIQHANINTLTVVIMEVPCCGGLERMAQSAIARSGKKIPMKLAMVSIQGEVIKEEWV